MLRIKRVDFAPLLFVRAHAYTGTNWDAFLAVVNDPASFAGKIGAHTTRVRLFRVIF